MECGVCIAGNTSKNRPKARMGRWSSQVRFSRMSEVICMMATKMMTVKENKRVKIIILLVMVPAVLLSCATLARDMLYGQDTYECKRMEEVCAKAKEYKKKNKDSVKEKTLGMDATLKAYEDACTDAKWNCHKSLRKVHEDDIEEVLPHLYRSKYAVAETHFVISESGKALAIDYGYNTASYFSPQKQHLSNRRPLLHGLSGLKKRLGIDRIDTVLVSHFHDDHVNGIPLLQRLFNSKVWAGKEFSDLLERPTRYDRPCLWHEPIPVANHLPNGQTIHWENIPITLYPMSGHTRFATMICMEVDDTRVVHTGDQIFFRGDDGMGYKPGAQLFTNHVYKNGLDLGCYKKTLADLRAFKPELVITGHTRPYRTSPEWDAAIETGAQAFDEVHQTLMLLDDGGVRF
jgi:glyoxylase-like metal-dependent hydrolase (beta-lactamase superfamily II)